MTRKKAARVSLAWEEVQASVSDQRLAVYKRFVDWYCRLYCVDVSDPQARDVRLETLVEEAVRTQSQPEPAGPENRHHWNLGARDRVSRNGQ